MEELTCLFPLSLSLSFFLPFLLERLLVYLLNLSNGLLLRNLLDQCIFTSSFLETVLMI